MLDRIDADADLAAHVEDEARRMARRCAHALGDPEQMIRLPGRCRGCSSVSLRAFPERDEVRCVNPVCDRPPVQDTGTDAATDADTDTRTDVQEAA